ncbi:MAG TPA: hypothetical protein EYG71_02395, partial [Leucothrix sp.]|nr:hypothetical protein [Leucothrix sp.]
MRQSHDVSTYMNNSLSPVGRSLASFFLLVLLGLSSTIQAEEKKSNKNEVAQNKNPVHETTLENGMKVLVKQDKRAPIAVIQVWYRIGTSYEHEG